MRQNVFIVGASGNVGRELVSQIVEKDGVENNCNPSKIVGVSNSQYVLFDRDGISEDLLCDIVESRELALDVLSKRGEKVGQLGEFLDTVKKNGMEGDVVFADVTAGKKELFDFHSQVLNESQNFLVTANKNPTTLFSMDAYNELRWEHGRYDTNTTVMGGAGILNFIKERYNIHDTIRKIEGVFSGTLGYILSELENGKKTFSQIVKDAKEGGYTEPNPMDDLNGLDVARKLISLAREAGHDVHIDDVEVLPLISEKYAGYTGDEFMNAIQAEDEYFAKKVQDLKENAEVLRYVGEMTFQNGKLKLKVGLKSVKKSSDLGTLSGTLNIAVVETDIFTCDALHVIKSPGAGLHLTAAAIRVGIASMLKSGLPRR